MSMSLSDAFGSTKVDLLFPTPIFYTRKPSFGQFNRRLEKRIYSLMKRDKGVRKTNEGGWQGGYHWRDFELERYVLTVAQRIQNRLDRRRILGIDTYWVNVNFPGTSNARHCHPFAMLACTYYVKVPKNSGGLYFDDSRSIETMWPTVVDEDPKRPWTFKSVRYQPSEGMIVLFPAWLQHGVEENRSKSDRISVSFNLS